MANSMPSSKAPQPPLRAKFSPLPAIPKEGSAHGYMLWEGDTFIWKSLEDRKAYRVWRAEEN